MTKYPFIISASAGSGKTHRLTEDIFEMIKDGKIRPDQLIATTFTVKAATELKGRIREKLIAEGKIREANLMNQALIGTINSVCLALLKRFAFEAGLSPMVETLDGNDQKVIIREELGGIVNEEFIELANKFYEGEQGFNMKQPKYIGTIESLISKLRSNDMKGDQLKAFGEASIKHYLNLQKNGNRDHDTIINAVVSKIDQGLSALEIYNSGTKPLSNTQNKQKSELTAWKLDLHNDNYVWNTFSSLEGFCQKETLKTPLPNGFHEELLPLLGNYFDNKIFREEYKIYIEKCFAYANEILTGYKQYKARHGLLDFVDQEAILHNMIHEKHSITKAITSDYKLIVVDEFQDVSPLQLSIFLRLTQLIDNNIWVGDPKQSIYAFRGADPELMFSVLKQMPDENKDQLKESWRSRKELVAFSNAIFTESFKSTMGESQVALTPASIEKTKRLETEHNTLKEAVNLLRFNYTGSANKLDKINALVRKVKTIVESGQQIFDKESLKYRAIRFEDISILCRANHTCHLMGNLFAKAGLPVSSSGDGLIYEAEVVMISALMKLLVLPSDSLAKAEVLLFSHFNGDQGLMIEDRLEAVSNFEWQGDHPYFIALQGLRKKAYDFSPTKAIEKIFSELDLEELFASWGNIHQRVSNVDAYLNHAQEYQEMCTRLQMASSISGFLNWMKDLNNNEEDLKGKSTGNAIQIMTYHQSKGLEWPAVFLWDLGFKMRDSFYRVNVVSDSDINIEDPLADRSLQYFVCPYNTQSSYVAYDDVIATSSIKQALDAKSIEEEKRLFYVAVTRARDYLYFCFVQEKKGPIYGNTIPTLVHPILSENTLMHASGAIPLSWKENELQLKIEEIDINEEQEEEVLKGEVFGDNYYKEKSGKKELEFLKINPSKAEPIPGSFVQDLQSVTEPNRVDKSAIDNAVFGNCIHDLICAYDMRLEKEAFKKQIQSYLEQGEFEKLIKAEQLYNAIHALYTYLEGRGNLLKIHKELPIQSYLDNGKLLNGFIDLIAEYEDGYLIVDHKTFCADKYHESLYKETALEYSGQLDLYTKVLNGWNGKEVLGAGIYFIFEGLWVEVQTVKEMV